MPGVSDRPTMRGRPYAVGGFIFRLAFLDASIGGAEQRANPLLVHVPAERVARERVHGFVGHALVVEARTRPRGLPAGLRRKAAIF
jgi:hypothetical protein